MDPLDSAIKCAISIEWLSATGTVQRKVGHKSALVTLKRNQLRDIFLEITADKFIPVQLKLRNVSVHNKFMAEGKASMKFKDVNCTLFLSNAPASNLLNFLKVIFVKINADACKTPPSSKSTLREQLLSGKLKSFDEISPVTGIELKKVTGKLAEKENTVISPTSRKRKLNAEGIAPAAKKLYQQFTKANELTSEQKRVLDACLAGQNVFFTGSAGTGKSFLLKKIIAALPPDVTVATASTGVAACHIGGVTLHSFAGIGTGEGTLERRIQLASRPVISQIWRKCKHLIIDEISMVEGAYFEKIEEIARHIRRSDKPFGGIQLILCGDFLQLPPIIKQELKSTTKKKFCFQTKAWEKCVNSCYELQKVHRQSDPEFVSILNSIRIGRVTEEITTRLQLTSNQVIDKDGILATQLCSLMQDVNAINERQLDNLPGDTKIYDAIDSDKNMSKQLDAQTTIPSKLIIKIGAQVMLMKNLNLSEGLVNGARGIVVKFSEGLPVVRFKSYNQEIVIKPDRWVIKASGGFSYSRKQIPLRLAWAFSIHKSQGLTLDCVEISLKSVFEAGQAYVALSRAKSLDTLRLLDFNSKQVWADPDVLMFYRNFRRRLKQLEIIPVGPVGKKSTALLKSIKNRKLVTIS